MSSKQKWNTFFKRLQPAYFSSVLWMSWAYNECCQVLLYSEEQQVPSFKQSQTSYIIKLLQLIRWDQMFVKLKESFYSQKEPLGEHELKFAHPYLVIFCIKVSTLFLAKVLFHIS